MKILIAEDDLFLREVLKRVLSHMADEIIEANDGLEALELIEEHDPDFLFTDIRMPALDGKALVEAIRSSRDHRLLPIVCMSSVKDKNDVLSLLSLGIQDYILKPIRPQEVHKRFNRVIGGHRGWRRRRQVHAGRTALLLVDPDANFRQFSRHILEQHFTVLEASSGPQALRLYRDTEPRPATILIGRGLPLMGEQQIKSVISGYAAEFQVQAPRVWLLGDDDVTPESASQFDGVIRKTFVPEAFATELRRTLLRGESELDRLESHLAESARPWLLSSARQVLGVMSGQEVSILDAGQAGTISDGVSALVMLDGQESRLKLLIACAREDAFKLAATVLMMDEVVEDLEATADVFGELSNTMGGRAVAALAEKGFELLSSLPEISQNYVTDASARWHLGEWFVTASGERFFVGLRVEGVAAIAA